MVSAPHMLCEVLMYISLMVILWGNTVFPYVAAWVASNQVKLQLLQFSYFVFIE